jgi:hypothetical protein
MFESFMAVLIVAIMGLMLGMAMKSTVKQDDSDDKLG